MAIVFYNSSPKIPKESTFGPKFRHFCFLREILQIEKFEAADFKYDNSFKILAQKYPNKALLVQNLGIFYFAKFYKYTNLRVLISNIAIVF